MTARPTLRPGSAAPGVSRHRTATTRSGLDRIKFNLDIVGGTSASLVEVAASGRWTDEPAPDAPEREIELRHRSRTIRVHLRGHEVVGMEDVGADLTFFPPLDVTER